jgi:transposase InsO family protein
MRGVPSAKATWCTTATAARSSQYVSIRYSERLAEAGIQPSVGSTGDSYDNALAETINGLYKAEIIHRRGPSKTREAVELVRRYSGSRGSPPSLVGTHRLHPAG